MKELKWKEQKMKEQATDWKKYFVVKFWMDQVYSPEYIKSSYNSIVRK